MVDWLPNKIEIEKIEIDNKNSTIAYAITAHSPHFAPFLAVLGLVLGLVSSIEQHFRRNSILFVFFVAVFTAAEAPRL